MTETGSRAVLFDRYGGREVLYVADVAMPMPAEDEVVVHVKAAAINPGEAAIRSGALADRFPATFPSGEGSDLAGIVSVVGNGVEEFTVGDHVLGFSLRRSSHAAYVSVPTSQLIHKPAVLSWEVAGSLYVVGCTAYAAVRAVDAKEGETIAVSAAAGGVGTVVVQLLGLRGSRVFGIASQANADWLRSHGVTPVSYGEGLADRLRAAAGAKVDAFIDLFGPEYLDLAVELDIPRGRIETIASFQRAQELGVKAEGSASASTPEVLTEMATLVASGAIDIPIAATFPLERVADAFAELELRHTRGKIVLIP
jgi:NADPH:quinone reductase